MHILGLLYNAGNIYKNIDRVKWLFGRSHFGIKNLVVLGVESKIILLWLSIKQMAWAKLLCTLTTYDADSNSPGVNGLK